MAIILLSFVGKQDPFPQKNQEEGSIVTLIKELSQHKNQTIKNAILLHTEGTSTEAELTRDWIQENYSCDEIQLIPVINQLSDDPVNLTLAIQEAKKALRIAQNLQQKGDILAFNASSGTPVMKSTWAILQSAGYAPHSNVWQVRNPYQLKSNQERVFPTNLNSLKKEFDLQIITKQIINYNYSSALLTIKNSSLYHPKIEDAINYGKLRLSFNFNQAYSLVNKHDDKVMKNLANELGALRQKNLLTLIKEVYFKASVKLKQKEYADFLVWLVAFHENLLKYLLMKQFGDESQWASKRWPDIQKDIINNIRDFDHGRLQEQIEQEYPNLRFLNIPVMMKIIQYNNYNKQELIERINLLDRYVRDRNLFIHEITAINDIKKPEDLDREMFKILQQLTKKMPDINPFDYLNKIILRNLKILSNKY
ncbi:hypothetical protein IQ215_03525 [Cyanobacterium stanieri LEGE 03274]|uniref:CRISPR-associated protein n=1 Tax=Cyanobacterium stanieri LEGE 03274 TaxID=1828756 RepID=A0ABR9V1J4_9CHRO|nr:hypothetical protein [Cyanobacterium stanieri]MBE9221758.1 hypothetical protein [Cyanobacterium stanieri LEGE 03274]